MSDPTLSGDSSPDRWQAALGVLRSRHSIGRTIEPPPSDEELSTLLACAARAPDHGGLRPTRYLLVRGAARELLGEVLAASLLRRVPATSGEALARERAKPLRAPLLIVVVSRLRDDVAAVPPLEQLLSSAVAAGYLMVAAHALGYGAMWRTGWPVGDPLVRSALGVGPGEAIVAWLYLGTPEGGRAPRSGEARADQGVGDSVDEWFGPAPGEALSISEAHGGHAQVRLGTGPQPGRPALSVQVEHDALTLAQHPKYRPHEGVGRQDDIAAVGVAHHGPLASGGVEGLDDALHGSGPPEAGAPSAPK